MEIKIIKSPTNSVKEMLCRRADTNFVENIKFADAIGMVQGRLIDMVFVADMAEKISNVTVLDIRGNCPQNIILIAILGDTSSVEAACTAIATWNGDEKNWLLEN